MEQKESTSETVLQVNSFIRGYHEYQEIWTPEKGDEYELKREPLNTVDHNAVAIVCKREGGRSRRKCIHENELNGETVLGHVPKLMALWLTKFLKRPTNKGGAVVKGKHVNRGADYGLEISCEYCFTGDEFSIQWLKSKLEEQGFL